MKIFTVCRLVDGEWKFWMYARGKTGKQVRHSVWWKNKGRVPKFQIKAQEKFNGFAS